MGVYTFTTKFEMKNMFLVCLILIVITTNIDIIGEVPHFVNYNYYAF